MTSICLRAVVVRRFAGVGDIGRQFVCDTLVRSSYFGLRCLLVCLFYSCVVVCSCSVVSVTASCCKLWCGELPLLGGICWSCVFVNVIFHGGG